MNAAWDLYDAQHASQTVRILECAVLRMEDVVTCFDPSPNVGTLTDLLGKHVALWDYNESYDEPHGCKCGWESAWESWESHVATEIGSVLTDTDTAAPVLETAFTELESAIDLALDLIAPNRLPS